MERVETRVLNFGKIFYFCLNTLLLRESLVDDEDDSAAEEAGAESIDQLNDSSDEGEGEDEDKD